MIQQENRKTEKRIDELTQRIIGAAIRVHTELGTGFLESVYEESLALEFAESGIQFERQKPLSILYREQRLDFLVENTVVVEPKAVTSLENIYFVIIRSYLKASGVDDALMLNFAAVPLTVKRVGREYTGAMRTVGFHV